MMNRNNAKDYLPLVTALADGKTLQVKLQNGMWEDRGEFFFGMDANHYRIKPEPRVIWQIREGDRVVSQLSSSQGFTYESAKAKKNTYQQRLPNRNYTVVTFVEQIEA